VPQQLHGLVGDAKLGGLDGTHDELLTKL